MVAIMRLILLLCVAKLCVCMYGPKSDVVSATEKSFSAEVLKHKGIVIVEFYAPWCGHCKSLEPEYEKAASVLKGVVKVVAVDATSEEGLAQKYGISGFPSLKVFGADKKSPTDYQGQRTADAIVSETMKAVNSLVKDRKKGGGAKSSSSSPSSTKPKASAGARGGSKKSKDDVVELTDVNFSALVTDSNDMWLVEFFAPWCGHCKNLAPEWASAATQLKGQVKLGAVDATVHSALAQKYGVQGYPTIKVFYPGKKGKAQDYQGPREAVGIVQFALEMLDKAGIPPAMPELTSPKAYDETCSSGKICVIMFIPHILDSGAKGRNAYLDTLAEVTKEFRGKPMSFAWCEGGAQAELEGALDVSQSYPTISVMSVEKKIYSTLKLSWSVKNIKSFLNGVLSGSEKTQKLAAMPKAGSYKAWDGKDAKVEIEEPPLDDMMA